MEDKNYIEPKIEVVEVNEQDVVRTSGCNCPNEMLDISF